jgi:hypothetical protein
MELCTISLKVHHEDVRPNVIVPYTETSGTSSVLDCVKLNLANQGIRPRLIKMERDFSYDLLLRGLWKEQKPFILVEHDIIPWPGALKELWMCSEPWCGFPYHIFGELRSYLGCTKFNPLLLGECPLPNDLQDWHVLDKVVERALMTRGCMGHIHMPAVTHLNFFHSRASAEQGIHPAFWTNETKVGA